MRRKWTSWLASGVLALVACASEPQSELIQQGRASLLAEQQQKLQVSDLAPNDKLGASVAVLGDVAVLGAISDDDGPRSEAGSVSVFVRSGSFWTLSQKVNAPEAACLQFGWAVALTSEYLFVGCPQPANQQGRAAVYVFARSGGVWHAVQRIDAPSPTELFGYRLAVSGSTLVVGGDALRVYVPDGALWVLQQAIPAPPASFSVDGDTLVRAYGGEDVGSKAAQGAAHVYVRSGSTWSETQLLVASDGEADDRFGNDVALEGDTLLVADRDDSTNGHRAGSVYVFARSGDEWVERQKLTSSDEATDDWFGSSIALKGDRALVGAALHEHLGQNTNHGSAYIFARKGGSWTEQDELLAVDRQNNDLFGSAVALSGESALIGAPNDDDVYRAVGSGYVFRLESELGDSCASSADCAAGLLCKSGRCCGGSCDVGVDSPCSGDADCSNGLYCGALGRCQVQKEQGRACEAIASQDCAADGCRVCATGACVDGFCCDSACAGNNQACSQALTGAPNGTCATALSCGSASGGTGGSSAAGGSGGAQDPCVGSNPATWVQRQVLAPADGGPTDTRNAPVAASGDSIAQGLIWDDDETELKHVGSVHVYERTSETYVERQRLTAPDGFPLDNFGASVALDGDTLLVGAELANGVTSRTGAAYVFVRSSTGWTFQQKLVAPDGGLHGQFGDYVGLAGDTALVVASSPPQAYVFVRSGSTWSLQQRIDHSATNSRFWGAFALSEDGNRIVANLTCGQTLDCRYIATSYLRSGSVWTEERPIYLEAGGLLGNYSTAVAMTGDTAFVATGLSDVNIGVVYPFIWWGASWGHNFPVIGIDRHTLSTFLPVLAARGDQLLIADSAGLHWVAPREQSWFEDQRLPLPTADTFLVDGLALTDETAVVSFRHSGTPPSGDYASLAIYGHCP